MKKYIYAIVALALLAACGPEEPIYKEVIKEVPVEPLTKYVYDGKDYTVHTLFYNEDEDYVEFMIAREPVSPFTSYIALFIHQDNVGKVMDFENPSLANRLDYMIIYEDVDHYYSPYFAPKKGTVLVEKEGAGKYSIDFTATMGDGKTLSFKYSGEFARME